MAAAAAAAALPLDLDAVAKEIERLTGAAKSLLAVPGADARRLTRAAERLLKACTAREEERPAAAAAAPPAQVVFASKPFPMLGAPIMDDVKLRTCDFLQLHGNAPTIEIEARLGVHWCPVNKARFVPDGVDTLYGYDEEHTPGTKFVPGVTKSSFEHLRACLMASAALHPRILVSTSVTTDTVYDDGTRYSAPDNKNDGKAVPVWMRKTRVASKEFSNPPSEYDFRLSASNEEPAIPRATKHITHERHKNRTSFRCQIWSIDLTVINHGESYEVEVEIWDRDTLFEQRERCRAGKPNQMAWIADGTLNHIRTLAYFADGKVPVHLRSKIALVVSKAAALSVPARKKV